MNKFLFLGVAKASLPHILRAVPHPFSQARNRRKKGGQELGSPFFAHFDLLPAPASSTACIRSITRAAGSADENPHPPEAQHGLAGGNKLTRGVTRGQVVDLRKLVSGWLGTSGAKKTARLDLLCSKTSLATKMPPR